MFVRNRWEIIYILPSKQGWENGAFWRLRGVIHDWEGGEGGGWVCCFIFHDSVQDCSSMGYSYNLISLISFGLK